jgi:hypothetical protein
MSAVEAERRLFGEALVCSDELVWTLTPGPERADEILRHQAMAERLLRSAASAEATSPEDPEHSPQDSALLRMEAKIDLALELLGRMLSAEQPQSAPRPVRWSRLGAQVVASSDRAAGSRHLLSLQLPTGLNLPLRLPVEVLACEEREAGQYALWLAFTPASAGLEAALERFLFRQHRRQIAAHRRGHG